MRAKEIRDMDDVELKSKLQSLKEEMFNLYFQLSTGQIDNPLRIKEVRKSIARCKTIMHERQLAAQRG
ncbi:MAG: 50S ribosomal protein L29 [Bacillota bacterium]|nr:50S ribosomal protein L29 [Bacillota bacterium]